MDRSERTPTEIFDVPGQGRGHRGGRFGAWCALALAGFAAQSVGAQWIEARPSLVATGDRVVVVATAADGAPLPGLAIGGALDDGPVVPLGRTDAAGACAFVAEVPGAWRLSARLDGVTLLAPLHVDPATVALPGAGAVDVRTAWQVGAPLLAVLLVLLVASDARRRRREPSD